MPHNKKRCPVTTDGDDLDGILDEPAMEATLKAVQDRSKARYDGVLGTLPDWVPRNFHDDFEGARNRVLGEGYELEVVQTMIKEEIKTGRAEYTRRFTPFPLPRDIKAFLKDINTLAHIKMAVAMEKVRGLAFLTDAAHAGRVVKGEQFSSGGASKKGTEGHLKRSIRKICRVIRSNKFSDVLGVIRNEVDERKEVHQRNELDHWDEDDHWDEGDQRDEDDQKGHLLHSKRDAIEVEFVGVNDRDEVIMYLNRGKLEGNEKRISFKTLRNILAEIKP